MCPLLPETDPVDSSYRDRVDRLVRSRFNDGEQRIWDDLVRSLPGIDPSTVLESIRRHSLTSGVDFNPRPDVVPRTIIGDRGLQTYDVAALPTPHPLDYCWWFDTGTVSYVVSLIRHLSSSRAHIALLGTPTIFDAATSARDTRRFSLIDSDPLVVSRRISGVSGERFAFLADLRCRDVSIDCAKVVIADPPWYEPETRAFLWASRQFCEHDAFVLMSVPPEGTRPGVMAEWERMVKWARTLGLEVEDHQRGVLSYVSPLFERNALFAAGVPPPRAAWRRGDLVRFRCVGVCRAERPRAVSGDQWCERIFGDVRIRVRRPRERREWRDPTLNRITESDVLPTVSRRDQRRDLVDVWTSGNRVFRCNGTTIVLNILDAIARDERSIASVEHFAGRHLTVDEDTQVRHAEENLRQIIQVEGTEVSTWREHHARVDVVTG